VAVNNAMAIRDIQHNTYITMEETLTMYNNRLDDNFNKAKNYLLNFAYDDLDIRVLERNDLSTTQWFSSLYRVRKSFLTALSIYKMNGFFLYSLPGDTIITETESNVSYKTLNLIKDTICPLIKDYKLIDKSNVDKWFSIQIDNKYYLFRVLRIYDSYIGTWISSDSALYPLVGNNLNDNVFLVNDDGTVLHTTSPVDNLSPTSLTNHGGYQHVEINKKTNLLVSVKMNFMNAYIVSLIPENQLFVKTQQYILLLIITLLFIFCLMIFTVLLTKQWVIQPLTNLSNAISSLRNGDLETVVRNKNSSDEFNEVYQAFNEMVSEIKTLKIDIYEEKLSKQHAQMQYLKLQIAPHFLINCISMVHQLLQIGRSDLSKVMLKDLSNHLRYTLSSGETVSLKQEIMHVENYIDLSKIRYPNGINLYTDCTSDSLSATVIPLLIQNFIENTIKHESGVDKQIDIIIRTSIIKSGYRDYLAICIWDTGSGFSKEMLNRLQDINQYVKENQSEHIGISNIFERSSLVYGTNNCHFYFSNRPGAGAQIDIELPYIPFSKEDRF
jgi:two-component system sensor histidine kinase YesM